MVIIHKQSSPVFPPPDLLSLSKILISECFHVFRELMTEVTGVIIARVVAMITVVTETTRVVGPMTMKNDVNMTEKGVGIREMAVVPVIDLGVIGREGIVLQDETEIVVHLHHGKESVGEDLRVILTVLDLLEGLMMIVVELRQDGGMKKTREEDLRKTEGELSSGNKLKLKAISMT